MKKVIREQFDILLFTVACVITVLLIISTQRQQTEDITVGAVSTQRYVADYEIENKVATDLLRDKAAEQVKDVYVVNLEVNALIMDELDNLFVELGKMRQESIPIKIVSTPDREQTEEPFSYTLESSVKLSQSQLEYMAFMPSVDFVYLKDTLFQAVENELDAGIDDDNTSLQRLIVTIRNELEELLDEKDAKIAYEVIINYLEPNAFWDEEATVLKKQEARNAVEPILVMKGEKIVGEAEKINEEAYEMLQALGYVEKSSDKMIIPMIGRSVISVAIIVLLLAFIRRYHNHVSKNVKYMWVIFTFYVMSMVLARALVDINYVYLPIIAFVMLFAVLIDGELSIILGFIFSLLVGLLREVDAIFYLYYFSVVPIAGMMGKFISDRDMIFTVSAILASFSTLIFYCTELIVKKSFWSLTMSSSLLGSFLMGILSVVFVVGTIPYWESLFGITSQSKLLDLSNPKNPLIRRMIIEAPGTYHHSLIVANLAETAAYDVGANSTLARVGGYYHDIGKMEYPGYFTENQMGENPHDYLDPHVSAQIIINHLVDGEKMARDNKLPEEIIKMIIEHHGNTLIKYFYHEAKEESAPNEIVNEEDFRYPYSPPSFKESAIVMLADTIEAAVRSMIQQGKTIDDVSDVIHALIKDKLEDGQLANSELTIKDLDVIHDSFLRVFKGMYQQRIPYPKGTTKSLDDLEEAHANKLLAMSETERSTK